MKTIRFELRGDYVELCNLLKLVGLAESGGAGKRMVAEGQVAVDGAIELRKTAKMRAGQRVLCAGVTVQLVAGPIGEAPV